MQVVSFPFPCWLYHNHAKLDISRSIIRYGCFKRVQAPLHASGRWFHVLISFHIPMSYSEKLSLWAIIPLRQHRRTWHMIAPCPYVCLQTRQMYNYNLKTDKLLQAHNIRYIIESWAVTSLHPSSIIQPTLAMERGVVWVKLLRGRGLHRRGRTGRGHRPNLQNAMGI